MKNKDTKTIALNKRASHEYLLEERFEAGMVLEGWEVKAMREGHAQITDTYVVLKDGEPYVINMHVPVPSHVAAHVSAHLKPESDRPRKLLLHAKEVNQLRRAREREGYTIVGTALYFKNNRVKIEIALGKGKKLHDKRQSDKDRDWKRQQSRIVKSTGR